MLSVPVGLHDNGGYYVPAFVQRISDLECDVMGIFRHEFPEALDRIHGVKTFGNNQMTRTTEMELGIIRPQENVAEQHSQIRRLRSQLYNLQDVHVRMSEDLQCAEWVSETFEAQAAAFARAETNVDPNLRSW